MVSSSNIPSAAPAITAKEDTEDDFGGPAEGISETTKSTVSVIDSLQTQEDKEK